MQNYKLFGGGKDLQNSCFGWYFAMGWLACLCWFIQSCSWDAFTTILQTQHIKFVANQASERPVGPSGHHGFPEHRPSYKQSFK